MLDFEKNRCSSSKLDFYRVSSSSSQTKINTNIINMHRLRKKKYYVKSNQLEPLESTLKYPTFNRSVAERQHPSTSKF